MRTRFSLLDCDDSAIQRRASWYTNSPVAFTQSLRRALPFLLFVAEQVEASSMPGEFAFLPYIESNYRALASSGNRSAGIWQLMPGTARAAGLRIDRAYDGRLDVAAATETALRLLGNYEEKFADWRLADMAYNAGEYAVRRHFDSTRARYSLPELRQWPLPRGAHEHLTKLLAVSCIVADPNRYGVQLPEPDADDWLVATRLPSAVDLDLAASLAHIDAQRLRELNPAFRHGHMPENGMFRLLMPAESATRMMVTLAQMPTALWRNWQRVTLRQSISVKDLADSRKLDTPMFLLANDLEADANLAAGTSILLPGRIREGESDHLFVADTAGFHRVGAGDSLWRIARQEHVSVAELRRWNHLSSDTLRIGQRLRLSAPEPEPAATTMAASAQ
jgi:membrane-bound lytic murein transglycosylase D